jgi:hypothetical protein
MSSIQSIIESFKGLSVEELLVIISAATAEAKKAAKVIAKAPKEAKEKKGSMPKGVSPPQLHKPRAWVDFVLAHANANGWPAITVKDTETLPASVEKDGKHVFEKDNKPLNNKQAMSLSKQYWARKEAVGSNKALYEEFEAQYVAPEPAAPKESVAEAAAEVVEVVIDAAVKAAAEVPVEAVVEEKAKKEKAKKEPKEKAKKEAKESEKPKKGKKEAKPKEEDLPFDIEADGCAHPWTFKGKNVFADADGNMWERSDDNEAGKWMGKYDRVTKTLDTAAEEPEYEEDNE